MIYSYCDDERLIGTKIGKQNGTALFGTYPFSFSLSYNRIPSIVLNQFVSPKADTKRSNPPISVHSVVLT